MTKVDVEEAARAAKKAVRETLKRPDCTHEKAALAAYYAVVEAGRQEAIAQAKIESVKKR